MWNIGQFLIDLIRGKNTNIKKCVKGHNNVVCTIYDKNLIAITKKNYKSHFRIKGDNNTVIFYKSFKSKMNKFPEGIDISINGNNNIIKIYDVSFEKSYVEINGDNNYFSLKKTIKVVEGLEAYISDGGSVEIEENCEIGNGDLYIVVNADYKNKHKLLIKKGTHIARHAIIRTSDGESIINKDGKPLNEPKDIIINENCWITSRCIILKGTNLPKGTIVGANSLVNDRFEEENTLIAGSPAKIIKKDIYWKPEKYNKNMFEYEQKIRNKNV